VFMLHRRGEAKLMPERRPGRAARPTISRRLNGL
jgi:hypothetical protein